MKDLELVLLASPEYLEKWKFSEQHLCTVVPYEDNHVPTCVLELIQSQLRSTPSKTNTAVEPYLSLFLPSSSPIVTWKSSCSRRGSRPWEVTVWLIISLHFYVYLSCLSAFLFLNLISSNSICAFLLLNFLPGYLVLVASLMRFGGVHDL